jgi:hypothetical protein
MGTDKKPLSVVISVIRGKKSLGGIAGLFPH